MIQNNRFNLVVLTYCAVALAIVAVVYQFAFRDALANLRTSGQISLIQSQDRLLGQLEAFQELSNFLARHPYVVDAARGKLPAADLNELLLRHALASGAGDIYMLDQFGVVIASSNFEEPHSFMGIDFSDRPDVTSAKTGRLGVYHGIETVDQTRDFFYTRGVLSEGKRADAFIVVKVDASLLEFNWRIDDKIISFVDEDGVAFLANRLGLLMRQDAPTAHRYPIDAVRMPLPFSEHRLNNHVIWRFEDGLGMPQEALVLERDIWLIDMIARVFLDTSDARNSAKLQAALAAAIFAFFGVYLLYVSQRRRQIFDQLRIEEAANIELEARVKERTLQLETAQSELIQASKLTALGQMSAGISHELNQPLSTIQNYAENSKKLLDRDRTHEARENMGRISEQATRMGRIIKNLRAFARKETEPLEALDFTKVVDEALSLAQVPLAENGVTVERLGDTGPAMVFAGKVRLQQVVVNLISNAIDAMTDTEERKIMIEMTVGAQVRVSVRDTGPGLANPDRVFEPFYTTKEIGASKGLGLGLSISYGMIGSFGGTLSASNAPSGGAIFSIELPVYKLEDHR